MSSPDAGLDRRRFIGRGAVAGLGVLALSGCGLRPLYGERGIAAAPETVARLARVRIETIPDRDGQILRNFLIDRFYRDGTLRDADHRLMVGLEVMESRTAIQLDDTANRRNLTGIARVSLVRTGTEAVVFGTTVTERNTFPFIEAPYGVLAARQSATRDLLLAIADQITTRVALYFERSV